MGKKNTEFGLRISRLRREKGSEYTQKKVAQMIGIGSTTYQQAESGHLPNGETLLKIAGFFKKNIHWLVTGEGPEEVPAYEPSDSSINKPVITQQPGEEDDDELDELTLDEFWSYFQDIVSDPAWRGWYRIELLKRFPELAQEIKKQILLASKDELERAQSLGDNAA